MGEKINMDSFEMEMLNDSLKALCDTLAEMYQSSLSDEEREEYEKRKQERFNR